MRHLTRLALAVSVLALTLVVVVPHHHDDATPAHHTQKCRLCRVHEGFSAAPPAASPIELPRVWVAVRLLPPDTTPRTTSDVDLPPLRAPPVVS